MKSMTIEDIMAFAHQKSLFVKNEDPSFRRVFEFFLINVEVCHGTTGTDLVMTGAGLKICPT